MTTRLHGSAAVRIEKGRIVRVWSSELSKTRATVTRSRDVDIPIDRDAEVIMVDGETLTVEILKPAGVSVY